MALLSLLSNLTVFNYKLKRALSSYLILIITLISNKLFWFNFLTFPLLNLSLYPVILFITLM